MQRDRTDSIYQCLLRSCAFGVLLLGAAQSQATLIGVTPGFPDIKVEGLTAQYDLGSPNVFGIVDSAGLSGSTTYTLFEQLGGPATSLTADDFVLSVVFSSPGVFSSGSISIDNGPNKVIAGDLLNFGYTFVEGTSGSPSTGTFDAIFEITAADDPQVSFDIGAQGVFIGVFDDLTSGITSGDDWPSTSFDNISTGNGIADVTGVPEPSTLSLMALALLGVGVWQRRKGGGPASPRAGVRAARGSGRSAG